MRGNYSIAAGCATRLQVTKGPGDDKSARVPVNAGNGILKLDHIAENVILETFDQGFLVLQQ